jgi:hypothetical protein
VYTSPDSGKVQVGGSGNDFFYVGQPLAQVIGGEGADTFAVLYYAEAIIWDFEVGTDALWLRSHDESSGRVFSATDITYSTSYGTFTLNTDTGQQVTLTGTAVMFEVGVTNAVFYPVNHGITAFLPGVQVTSLSDLHVQTFTDFSFI